MKKSLLLLSLVLTILGIQANAQRPGGGAYQSGSSITGKITGTLIDTTTNVPVEFATVVVVNPKNGDQLDGGITDEKGEFKLPTVKLGTYELHFSFLGYRPKVITGVELTPENPDYDAGEVFMVPEGVTLAEVEVTGEAAVVENRIDKLVYNADKDVTAMGGDASNILQKVPLLAVDSEGNVSLRGSSNVQILINGKPSTIFSTNPADALKTIPADQIKTVEVITTPTAKFDGEGSGGIINIITKKKSIEGFTGSANATVGNLSNRGSLNLNYARGRFGMNFTGSGWWNPKRPSYNDFLRVEELDNGEQSVLEQRSDGDSQFYGPRATMGLYYDINAYNNITSSIGFRGFGRNSFQETPDATFVNPAIGLNRIFSRTSTSESFRSGFDWNTDYTRTFKKPKQELRVGFQFDMDFSNSENRFDQTGNDESLLIRNLNENDGINAETTGQVDYAHPFSKNVLMETGVKAILRDIESDFTAENFDFDANEFVVDPNNSDVFYYDQDVYAAYLSFNIKLGEKYGMVVGGRYEQTEIAGDFDFVENKFTNSYGNFLPSIIISRNLSQFSNIKAAYNQRIRRPGLRFVNPYVDVSDPFNIEQGNPELLPEVTHQAEVTYGTYVKGVVLNASVFYRLTTDNIESFLDLEESGVSRSTYRNIGRTESIGASFFSSVKVKEKLTLRASATINSYEGQATINGQDLNRTAFVWNGNVNATLSLKKDWKVEVFGFYNSPRQTIQGSRASYRRLSFGILKEFSPRFSMGLNVAQPLQRDLVFANEFEGINPNGNSFVQESEFGVESRAIGLNIRYQFGKLDFKDRFRGRRRDRNNDLLEGDGGQGIGN